MRRYTAAVEHERTAVFHALDGDGSLCGLDRSNLIVLRGYWRDDDSACPACAQAAAH